MPNLIDFLWSLLPRRKPDRSCGTMLLWGLPPEKAREVVAALDALSYQYPHPEIPRLSCETMARLSTHERRVVQKSPQAEREPDPDDDGYPRMICLTLALESGKQLDQDKLQAIMRRRCVEGGLILVEPPK